MNLIMEILNNIIFLMMIFELIEIIKYLIQMMNKMKLMEVKVLIEYYIDHFHYNHYELIKANEMSH